MRPPLALAALVLIASIPAISRAASDEIPGPGVKIERRTVGGSPQSLTHAELEKLARVQASSRVTPGAAVTRATPAKAPSVSTIGHGSRDASPTKVAKRARIAGARRPAGARR
jgi:hypothetical protein